jgi:hypothetical protein
VADKFGDESNDATNGETAASDACTRSGTFALALSVVLFMLLTSWAHRPSEVALAQYVAYRYDLSLYIERLDENPIWNTFKESHEIENTPLGKLPNTVVQVSQGSPTAAVEKTMEHPAITKHDPGWRPQPPTALTLTQQIEIPEISEIVDIVKRLNDSRLLTDSRKYSNFFNFSIGRWAQKRTDTIYRNSVNFGCATKEIEVPHKEKTSDEFVPELETDDLLGCTYLRDLRDLAKFEQPIMTNPDQIGGHVGRDIDIAPGALPREPYIASLVSELLLFFVLIYFGAFAREATLSERFPVQGTLFGAFSRSRWTLIVMFLALCTPFFASLVVAIESKRLWLWVGTVLILMTVCSVIITLNRKSYWIRLKNSK